MVTTVVKSIGTGGAPHDYSTIQSWEDALPSDLTASRNGQTLQAGSTTGNAVLDAGASGVDSFYNGLTITVSGEERLITAYVGASKTATIGALNGSSATWSGAPSAGTAFTINSVNCQGECHYNTVVGDGEFAVAGTVVTISGETTDSTHTITLTAATGQSFVDNANVQSNALTYNASNGVGLRKTTPYGVVISINAVANVSLKRLQMRTGAGNASSGSVSLSSGALSTTIDQCIMLGNGTNQGQVVGGAFNTSLTITNSLAVNTASSGANTSLVRCGSALVVEFCTLIHGGGTSSVGARSSYSTANIKNSLVYGAATPAQAAGTLTSTTNQSDVSASGFTVVPAIYQFANVATDFRLKWGAPAQGAATADVTYPTDIAGTARPQSSSWDIGCWELTAPVIKSIGTAVGSAGTGTVSVTNGSTAVVGTGTLFLTEMEDANGFPLTFQVGANLCNVASIADDTHLTLKVVYPGTSNASAAYTRGSRNYSSLQAWDDALPASTLTAAKTQIGEIYNDSEYVSSTPTAPLTMSATTTDAPHGLVLRTAAGQSFRDNANAQTNPLAYDQTKGVGIKATDHRAAGIDMNFVHNFTVKGIQILAGRYGIRSMFTAPNTLVEDVLVEVNLSPGIGFEGVQGIIRNSLCVIRTATVGINGIGMNPAAAGDPASQAVNCTVVRPSTYAATGIGIPMQSGSGAIVTNCAIFGFTTALGTGISASSSNNASDVAITIGTSNQASLTYANQFVTITDAGRDFRTKAGASLLDNGVTDTVNAAFDIVGTTRPSGGAYDIGAWEVLYLGVRSQLASFRKQHFEVTCNAIGTSRIGIGVVNVNASLSGTDANSIIYFSDGKVLINGTTSATLATWTSGNTIAVEFDTVNNKVWFAVGAGGWNNDILANQNPATNTGGISISTITGPFYAAAYLVSSGDQVTSNFTGPMTRPISDGFVINSTSLVRQTNKPLQATSSPLDTLTRSFPRTYQATAAALATLTKQTVKLLQASASAIATLVNSTLKLLQDSSSPIATLTRQATKLLQASSLPVATLANQIGKFLQASSLPVATLARQTSRLLQASSSPLATLTRQTAKLLQASSSPLATLANQTVKLLQASSSPLATLANQTGKLLTATSSAVATLVRQTGKILQTLSALVATVSTNFIPGGGTTFDQSAQAASTAVATLVNQTGKLAQASTAALATLTNQTAKLLQALGSAVASSSLVTGKPLSASSGPVATLTRSTLKLLQAAATAVATSVARLARGLNAAASTSPIATTTRSTGKTNQGSSPPTASLQRDTTKPLLASTSPSASATFGQILFRALQAFTSPGATLAKLLPPIRLQALASVIASFLGEKNTGQTFEPVTGAATLFWGHQRNYSKLIHLRAGGGLFPSQDFDKDEIVETVNTHTYESAGAALALGWASRYKFYGTKVQEQARAEPKPSRLRELLSEFTRLFKKPAEEPILEAPFPVVVEPAKPTYAWVFARIGLRVSGSCEGSFQPGNDDEEVLGLVHDLLRTESARRDDDTVMALVEAIMADRERRRVDPAALPTLNDALTIEAADGTRQTISVDIVGNDGGAVVSGAGEGRVQVEGAIQPPTLAGTYGDFTFDPSTGAWTYRLDPAKDSKMLVILEAMQSELAILQAVQAKQGTVVSKDDEAILAHLAAKRAKPD